MPFIVAEPCVRCKFTDCVEVCPVDCFHEGVNMLVIDPIECIDCGACVPECPVEAIYLDDDVPDKWKEYIQLNADLAPKWPVITARKDALPDAEEWRDMPDKRGELSMEAGDGD